MKFRLTSKLWLLDWFFGLKFRYKSREEVGCIIIRNLGKLDFTNCCYKNNRQVSSAANYGFVYNNNLFFLGYSTYGLKTFHEFININRSHIWSFLDKFSLFSSSKLHRCCHILQVIRALSRIFANSIIAFKLQLQ